jgi:hypothetical protein
VSFQHGRAPEAAATDCGALKPSGLALFHGVNAPADGCTCGCGAAAGGQCSGGATLWQFGGCGGGGAAQPNICYDIHTYNWQIGGVSTTQVSVSTPGTCTTNVSGSLQPATWNKALDLCRVPAAGAGCGAGALCVPRPAAPLENLACVEQAGKPDCPIGYPQQTFYFESFTDNRTCSATGCTCSEASGQICDFHVALYTGSSCNTTALGNYPFDGGCHPTGYSYGDIGSTKIVGTIEGGACQPAGTASIQGAVTPTGAHAVCCKQL